jgi:hypothetical protein
VFPLSPVDARTDLLKSISKGIALKKVEPAKVEAAKPVAAAPTGIAALLARREAIKADSDSEDDDDDEWA